MVEMSGRAGALAGRLARFMEAHVYPAEPVYAEQHTRWSGRLSLFGGDHEYTSQSPSTA